MSTLTNELSNAIQDLIETRGDKVGLGTDDCRAFKESHKSCAGCQYELGCSKQVAILLTTFAPDRQDELIDSILAAKTPKGVQAIHFPEPDFYSPERYGG